MTRMQLDLKLAQASLFVICSTRNRSYNHTYIHEYNKYSSYSSIYSSIDTYWVSIMCISSRMAHDIHQEGCPVNAGTA